MGGGRFVVGAVRNVNKAGVCDIEGHGKDFGSLEDGSQRVSNKGVILTDSLKQSSGCCEENTIDYGC